MNFAMLSDGVVVKAVAGVALVVLWVVCFLMEKGADTGTRGK